MVGAVHEEAGLAVETVGAVASHAPRFLTAEFAQAAVEAVANVAVEALVGRGVAEEAPRQLLRAQLTLSPRYGIITHVARVAVAESAHFAPVVLNVTFLAQSASVEIESDFACVAAESIFAEFTPFGTRLTLPGVSVEAHRTNHTLTVVGADIAVRDFLHAERALLPVYKKSGKTLNASVSGVAVGTVADQTAATFAVGSRKEKLGFANQTLS